TRFFEFKFFICIETSNITSHQLKHVICVFSWPDLVLRNVNCIQVCDPQNPGQQFRWTSENRIFNVAEKKCLGTGNKTEGSKLQWYQCDADSDLQKWECENNSLFGLKNETLYLSIQDNSNSPIVSSVPGEKGKWTLHGMTDSICSHLYEELYTLKGNALGRPCHFPFLYNDKWYTNCTTEGRSPNLPWCAVESEYEPNQLWGYCPTQLIVYKINTNVLFTQTYTYKYASDESLKLFFFKLGLTDSTGPVLWTGLNSLDALSGWRWVNGQPLHYLKWLSGQPSSLPGYSCGVLDQSHDSGWSTAVCSERHGYICQRGLIIPTVPPGSCHSPWISYSGHCYLLSRTKRTWLEARDSCRREGGDLLSILNIEEQSFTITQLGYAKTDELWIGFNDLKTNMLFEWSDHSRVPYVLWDVNEPSNNVAIKEDCVMMRGEEGKWADQICQNKYGYICKKKAQSESDTYITNPVCKPGWVRYGNYCYLTGSGRQTFEEAKQMCENAGSYLADVTNSVENAFLVSLIGAQPEKHFWIGLSNQEDQSTFEWTNNMKVPFTHFNHGMPGGKQGCVGMTTGVLAGLWDVLSCTNAEKYICKQKAERVITTLPPATTPAVSCSPGWNPLTNRDFCFKVYEVEHSQRILFTLVLMLTDFVLSFTAYNKTDDGWIIFKDNQYYIDEGFDVPMAKARSFCKHRHGDLVAINDEEERVFLWQLIKQKFVDFFIGLRIDLDKSWMDGSPVVFQAWQQNQPAFVSDDEHCVKMNFRQGRWANVNCGDNENFICKRRGSVSASATAAPTEPPTGGCPSGWVKFQKKVPNTYIKLGNSFYKIVQTNMTWAEAQSYCEAEGAKLASIRDAFTQSYIELQTYKVGQPLWIGLNSMETHGSFQWIDKWHLNMERWDSNEPTLDYPCVYVNVGGMWKTAQCNQTLYSLCKKSTAPPAQYLGLCPEPAEDEPKMTWLPYKGHCYAFVKRSVQWTKASRMCMARGANLVSILDPMEAKFLQNYLRLFANDYSDYWIGIFKNHAGKMTKIGYKILIQTLISHNNNTTSFFLHSPSIHFISSTDIHTP
uniref:Mannose receptor, C type 1b n=1 Tax=Astyanax mexicanus TaxID=7994 RepID=A0A8B9GYZ1_ASTMX